uniref:hypothetical protein n=1 Tax=Polynucleobacter sp. TaxID=2029855 RepID=UPI004047EA9D
MLKSKFLIVAFFLAFSAYSQAQTISNSFQKNCIQEQLEAHQDLKNKALTEADFKPYCSCLSAYISQNASNGQVKELLMNPKAKPEWLKAIELKAMKSCLASGPKITT